MLFRLALTCLSWLAFTTYSVAHDLKQAQQVTNIKPSQNYQIFVDDSATNKHEWEDSVSSLVSSFSTENKSPLSVETSSIGQRKSKLYASNKKNDRSEKQLAATVRSLNYMTLSPTRETNPLGNPLYELRLYANGRPINAYLTVSGRKHTQNRNRNKAGTEAPLPDGKYKVTRLPIAGSIPEAGNLFLPIQPLFSTGRSALGIHYDPSFGKNNGEDGTSGCIALTNKQELNQVLNYVRTYQPQYLEVNIR